jgi:shikimate 5-dehydrogenase
MSSRFLFVGVSTARSSIVQVFPAWMEHLGIDCALEGVDCRIHDDPAVYRGIVSILARDPGVVGALVTAHKVDLYAAAGDLFGELDPCARLLGEVSCISKRDGRLLGTAVDAVSGGLALEAFVPAGHFASSGGEVCILGAGGASAALVAYLTTRRSEQDRPRRITVTDRAGLRLAAVARICERMCPESAVSFTRVRETADNDAAVSRLPAGSLVVNATGLGKDGPGSPIGSGAPFPERGYAWDLNYRGDLLFLRQAAAQAARRRVTVENGWGCFVHGWTRALAIVFGLDLPASGPGFERIAAIAAAVRAS